MGRLRTKKVGESPHLPVWNIIQHELSDKKIIMSDSYFISVKTTAQSIKFFGCQYCGVVKKKYTF